MTTLLRASILSLALSVAAQAGTMQFDKTEPPPPPPPATSSVIDDEAETVPTADETMQFDTLDAASQATLSVLQSLLTLL
jgi:hypothetical protein